ncbi:P-loop containing nucleoside triphosphate hydrolase protein [Xylaria intraflava]|nr:P-loop containing nucleoside triphosphate hydrolase protein [Xylaria intraflava]
MRSRHISPSIGGSIPSNTDPSESRSTDYAQHALHSKSSRFPSLRTSPEQLQHVRFDDSEANQGEPPAKRVKLIEGGAAIQNSHLEKSKKSKRKKTRSIQDDMPKDLDVRASGHAIEEPAVQTGAQADTTGGSDTIEMQQIPSLQIKESSPSTEQDTVEIISKRKDRKKKKKSNHDREPEAELPDDIPLRHKAILEKKAKSIRGAPELGSEGQGGSAVNDLGSTANGDASKQTPEIELHGLEPIPQPAPVAPDSSIPTYETLPPWLALPTRIPQEASAPFTEFGLTPDLGITAEIAERLASKGYKQAFAIQTGVIPLLLPNNCKTMQGDVLVSAATGSGKTLAYALPIIREISQSSRHTTRLRALIVVPTRELVKQVQQICEDCAGVFALDGAKRRARITMAMGSQSFEHEQNLLIEREEIYDPARYKQRLKRLARLSGLDPEAKEEDGNGGDDDSGYNTEDEERDSIRRREDKLQTMPDHVIAYKSKTDILICTPGRLVEHIKFTPGFSLDFVRWLVVDEADKLLGQNFQQWLDVVIPRLRSHDQKGSRNHKQSNLSGVRKIVLSATMTRDLDQLEGLKLRRPKLVVLEGAKGQDDDRDALNQTEHTLPELLEETALKVGDPNLKPLFLVDLLLSRYVLDEVGGANIDGSDDDETSSSGSDSDSDSESDSAKKPTGNLTNSSKSSGNVATVLIFTKSNETALRLSRLLTLLAPTLEPLLGTLTSTTPYTSRRDTLRAFNAGRLRIIVASDLVARGIDLSSLDHVINYDMPSSIASYVHRVGRTARAGNAGKAWTLFTNPEARWFWSEVASDKTIRRNKQVERIRVTEEKDDTFNDKVAVYEAALEQLGQEAGQARHKSRQE